MQSHRPQESSDSICDNETVTILGPMGLMVCAKTLNPAFETGEEPQRIQEPGVWVCTSKTHAEHQRPPGLGLWAQSGLLLNWHEAKCSHSLALFTCLMPVATG